jgi:DNA-binding NarL/FixJ family response regulator
MLSSMGTNACGLGPLARSSPDQGPFAMHQSPPVIWPDFLAGQTAKPVRVLLVDDDAHMRQVIAQELMADARTLLVAQAASVREGRRAIKQHEFDVMLADIHLGDGEGLSLIDYMKSIRPSAEAIVISIMENDDQVLHAFELGATGYLVKNSWFGNYPQAVLQVANGGASITPHLARRLLQRFDGNGASAAAHAPRRAEHETERLSQREKEVLRMVASGQHGDRHPAAHQRPHGEHAHQEHLPQAAGAYARAGRALRLAARPVLKAAPCSPSSPPHSRWSA